MALAIQADWERRSALTKIGRAQAEASESHNARMTFALALEAAEAEKYDLFWPSGLNEVASAQAVSGQWEEAQTTLALVFEASQAIEDHGRRAIAFAELAAGQVAARELSGARAAINLALKAATAIEDKHGKLRALTQVAGAQALLGERAKARATFVSASTLLDAIDDLRRPVPLADLAKAEAAGGEFDLALATAARIDRDAHRDPVLGSIARMQAVMGLGAQAILTTDMIVTRRDLHVPEVAVSLGQKGDLANFMRLLIPCAYYPDAAYRMCEFLVGFYPRQASAIAKVVQRAVA